MKRHTLRQSFGQHCVFIIFVIFSLPSILFAQYEFFYEDWRWVHFTTRTGLPSNYVEDVIETDDGTVWAVTDKGIAFYDGFQWNKVIIDSTHPHARFQQVTKGIHGKLFVVHNNSLFWVTKEKAFRFLVQKSLDNIIHTVSIIDSIRFFFSTVDGSKIHVYEYHNGKISSANVSYNGHLNYIRNNFLIYIGSDVSYYKNGVWRDLPFKDANITSYYSDTSFHTLLSVNTPKEKIGLWHFDGKAICKKISLEEGIPVRTLSVSDAGESVVYFESGKLFYNGGGNWIQIDPTPWQFVFSNKIIFRNNSDLWVCTEQGLFLIDKKNRTTSDAYLEENASNFLMEIIKTQNNDVWLGTSNGIQIFHPNSLEKVEQVSSTPLGLVTGILEDVKGTIWAVSGSGFKGILEFTGGKWKLHQEGLLGRINYHKIRMDSQGKIWFLGLGSSADDPAGFVYYENTFHRMDSLYPLPSNRIYDMVEDSKQNIYLGSRNGFVRIRKDSIDFWSQNQISRSTTMYALDIDMKDRLWFSNYTSNIGYLDEKDSIRWVWYYDDNNANYYKRRVWDLVFDRKGVLWVATTRGLYSFFNNAWTLHDYEDLSSMRELRCVLPLRDKIYVGGHGMGIRVIDRTKTSVPIQIAIEKVLLEEGKTYFSWYPMSYWGGIPFDKIETRYSLDDNVWSEWNNSRELYLFNLSSGQHSVYLQAKDYFGNIYSAAQTFTIPLPYYFQWQFIVPIVIFFSSALILLFQIILERKMHQHILDVQRQRIASDLHDEVGSNLGSIALIGQHLARHKSLTKKIKNDLMEIVDTSMQTSDFLRDIVWYINPKSDDLVTLEVRLKEIARRMLLGIVVTIETDDAVRNDRSLLEVKRNITLIFKEALHNILRHSRATKVTIRYTRSRRYLHLEISDNGVGFDLSSDTAGNGLLNMKKRADEIDAVFLLKSEPGRGTTMQLSAKCT